MSNTDAERPIFMIQDDKGATRHWTLEKDEITIGRGEECDLVLAERQISRQHLRVYRDGDLYHIQDLESKNGTWVNGLPLKGSRELRDGDEIHVALVIRLRFIDSDATSPLATQAGNFLVGGKLRLEPDARRVFVNGVELNPPLSLPQYRLLELLYVNGGHICTREQVVEAVWPDVDSEGVSEQAIDALVRRLRDRLGEVDPETQYILTVRGHGFRLEQG